MNELIRRCPVTGLKHAFEDMLTLATPSGIAVPGFDGDEDRALEHPFIVARFALTSRALDAQP